MFAEQPATLAAIGHDVGRSRERVRQVEAQLASQLADDLTAPGSATSGLLAALRAAADPVIPLRRLIQLRPALGRVVPAVGVALWHALGRIGDTVEFRDGWAAAPSLAAARQHTRRLLDDLAKDAGIVALPEAVAGLGGGRLRACQAQRWLAWCGLGVHAGYVLASGRALGDRAAAVLARAGQPLTLGEIAGRLGIDRRLQGCGRALAADPRVCRVGPRRWALAAWGQAPYISISDVIGQEVDACACGGSISLAALTATLVDRYGVAPASVAAYASSAVGPSAVRHGVVARRSQTADHNAPPGKRTAPKGPCETTRLYRHDAGWRYRLRVTVSICADRGSRCPSASPGWWGARPRGVVCLDARLGAQPVRWTSRQPTTGSVRRFLTDLGVGDGATVLLWFGNDHRFDLQRGPDPAGSPTRCPSPRPGRRA